MAGSGVERHGPSLPPGRLVVSPFSDPEPPALLARLEAGAADALVASLRKAGLPALAIDAHVPRDADRTSALRVAFTAESVTFTPRAGDPMQVAWPDVLAVLRGSRESRSEVERTEKSKSLSVGMAIAAGGLMMSRTSSKTVHSSDTSFQQVILVYARDGRAAALVEGLVDFSCLGSDLQPSTICVPACGERWSSIPWGT